jgi:hypothetical protein
LSFVQFGFYQLLFGKIIFEKRYPKARHLLPKSPPPFTQKLAAFCSKARRLFKIAYLSFFKSPPPFAKERECVEQSPRVHFKLSHAGLLFFFISAISAWQSD